MHFRIALIVGLCLVSLSGARGDWEPTNGPYGGPAGGFAVVGGSIFTFTGDSLFRSVDTGRTWLSFPQPRSDIYGILAFGQDILLYNDSELFRSSPDIANWVDVGRLPYKNVRSISYLAGSLFTWSSGGGLSRSIDSGVTWLVSSAGLDDSIIGGIAFDGNTLYLATGSGVRVSLDSGLNWTHHGFGAIRLNGSQTENQVWNIAYLDLAIYVTTQFGVYYTGDNGWHWQPAGEGSPYAGSYATLGTDVYGTIVYATMIENGVKRIESPKWKPMNHGIPTNLVYWILSEGNVLVVGTVCGLYYSTDSAKNWTPAIRQAGKPLISVLGSVGSTVLASDGIAGLYSSADLGLSWSRRDIDTVDWRIRCFGSFDNVVFAGTEIGLFKSIDSGVTWLRADTGIVRTIDVWQLARSGKFMFLSGGFSFGTGVVLRSSDEGMSWTTASQGLPQSGFGILASNDSMLIAAGDSIYTSTDFGLNWRNIGVQPGKKPAGTLMLYGAEILLGNSRGLFRSLDNGVSWLPSNSGLTDSIVRSLCAVGEFLFAGCNDGVYLSRDSAKSWHRVSPGLSTQPVKALTSLGGYLFATQWYNGVWRRPLSEMTGTGGVSAEAEPKPAILQQNHPNPFTGSTTIEYRLATAGPTRLKIYNTLGQEVATLVDETQSAGAHLVEFDGNGFANGVYSYRLTAGGTTLLGKMTLQR